jgi:type 2 lantibiotic, mersacidin/lichenicidin family
MEEIDIARAWKSESYRDSLTPEQRHMVPASPAGIIELSEEDLVAANGGGTPILFTYSLLASGAASVVASFAGCTGK